MLALALLYAWFGAYAPSFTLASYAVVLGGLLPVLVVMVARRGGRLPLPAPIRPRGVAVWALILGSFAVQEVINVALDPTVRILHSRCCWTPHSTTI